MPQDGTPRQPQAWQPEGRAQGGSESEAGAAREPEAFPEQVPEQVFAGECGDPIWEGRRPAEPRPSQPRVPRPASEERVPAGRIIDLVQRRAPGAAPAGTEV